MQEKFDNIQNPLMKITQYTRTRKTHPQTDKGKLLKSCTL